MRIKLGDAVIGRDVSYIKPFVYGEQEFIEGLDSLIEEETSNLKEGLIKRWENGNILGDRLKILEEIEEGGDITKGLLLENLQLDGFWWDKFKGRIHRMAVKIQRQARETDAAEYMSIQRDLAR